MLSLFILLLAAHVYGDFVLQSAAMAQGKRHRLLPLLAHIAIHGGLVYAVLQQWTGWQVPVAVMVLHGLIDAIKSRCAPSASAFAWDQAAHAVSLVVVAWLGMRQGWCEPFSGRGWYGIVGLAGLGATVRGAGFFVGAVTDRIIAENPDLREQLKEGLKDGGKRIGQLERAVIFILILAGQPSGIGFLVAAKSILRFEEAKKQPVAEYVLIGTLWSFGLAMALAWLTQWALSLGGGR